MSAIVDIVARTPVALFAVAIAVALAIAALSRDLGKRLFGAGAATVAAVAFFAAMTRNAPDLTGAALAATAIMFAGFALGLACLVRVREAFGGLDAGGLSVAEAAEDEAERGG